MSGSYWKEAGEDYLFSIQGDKSNCKLFETKRELVI